MTRIVAQSFCDSWASCYFMVRNAQVKGRQRRSGNLGQILQHNLTLTPLQTDQGTVERVYDFKLLGVHIDSTLTWTKHIDYITKKATKRLYFLKVLKRAGLPSDHLLHYYTTVIRPVLEYCSCIWHHNIPNKLSLQVYKSIYKNAQLK